MVVNITLDPITKRFIQIKPEEKVCYICSGNNHVDDHHYDLQYGKISPETVPLCRRCHKTIHMRNGIHMFEDALLDRAIEVFNKTQSLFGREVISKDQIKRSKYWLKKHGIKDVKGIDEGKGSQTPVFPPFRFPDGEPLCGWQWVNEHRDDLMDYVPRIEVVGPGINLAVNIDSAKDLREVTMVLRGLRKDGNNRHKRKIIILDPITNKFSEKE